MARRPTVPCARGCGQLMWTGSSSLPPGQATCQSCRRQASVMLACARCGRDFAWNRTAKTGGFKPKTCGPTCAAASRTEARAQRPRPCGDCGTPLLTGAGRHVFCEACSQERRLKRWRRKNATRRGAKATTPPMSIRELGERDGWRCHLCRRTVRPDLRVPHRMAPTFDHLVPVSAGGSDEPENLRLAHLSCNSRRGAGGTVQLLLVG